MRLTPTGLFRHSRRRMVRDGIGAEPSLRIISRLPRPPFGIGRLHRRGGVCRRMSNADSPPACPTGDMTDRLDIRAADSRGRGLSGTGCTGNGHAAPNAASKAPSDAVTGHQIHGGRSGFTEICAHRFSVRLRPTSPFGTDTETRPCPPARKPAAVPAWDGSIPDLRARGSGHSGLDAAAPRRNDRCGAFPPSGW